MKQYLELVDRILTKGKKRQDRTGVGTVGLFGEQIRMDLSEGFPLLTTKKVHTKSIIYELLWFLRGDTNIKYLNDHNVTIWDEWADENGDLGPVYGEQWVRCKGLRQSVHNDETGPVLTYSASVTNQVKQAVETLRKNPYSRRNVVSAWNVSQIDQMKLPPCHTLWQLYVEDSEIGQKLNLHLYARSIDTFLGLPFNIASYAFLLSMLAHVSKMTPGELVISFGDVHIYLNHIGQCELQMTRSPRPLPTLKPFSQDIKEIDEFDFEDFVIEDYFPHPPIKAQVAV